jgi:hypothetical protein
MKQVNQVSSEIELHRVEVLELGFGLTVVPFKLSDGLGQELLQDIK